MSNKAAAPMLALIAVLSWGAMFPIAAHAIPHVEGGVGFGSLLVLAGVFGWVLYTLGAADFPEWSPLRYTTLSAIPGTLSIFAITEVATLAGWVGAPSARDIGDIWPELAFIVVMGALVAVLAWNSAIRAMGPQNTSLFIN